MLTEWSEISKILRKYYVKVMTLCELALSLGFVKYNNMYICLCIWDFAALWILINVLEALYGGSERVFESGTISNHVSIFSFYGILLSFNWTNSRESGLYPVSTIHIEQLKVMKNTVHIEFFVLIWP